ncbi:ATP-dependent endonuclease, partial [Natrarchaeobius sp. A-rgal3]|uniref:ATP-dependent nuclease n=1 Tax=Natrarchaeobius versutus TaxID=1679078 RepID=UPI00350FA739
ILNSGTTRKAVEKSYFTDIDSDWVPFREAGRCVSEFDGEGLKRMIGWTIEDFRFVSPFRQPRNMGTPHFELDLEPSGDNLVEVLHSLEMNQLDKFESISESFIDIMDGVTNLTIKYDVEAGEKSNKEITIIVEEDNYDVEFKSEDISSGSKEILVLLTQLHLAADDTSVLFLEEPELHMHPGAENKVFGIIRDLVKDSKIQVVISTHSDVFVNQANASSITRVDRNGKTTLRSIKPENVDVELQDLGYEKSELLQSEVVVFVEGVSDKRVLRQFLRTAGVRIDETDIEIVELEGINNMKKDSKSLVKLLYSFNIPYLFVRDRHDLTIEQARGELFEKMTRSDNNEWWDVSLDNIIVWDAYGIEKYLLIPRAISQGFELSREEVNDIILNSSDKTDEADLLNEVFKQEHKGVTDVEEVYDKKRDGMYIAKEMKPNELHDDVIDVLSQIVALSDSIDPNSLKIDVSD